MLASSAVDEGRRFRSASACGVARIWLICECCLDGFWSVLSCTGIFLRRLIVGWNVFGIGGVAIGDFVFEPPHFERGLANSRCEDFLLPCPTRTSNAGAARRSLPRVLERLHFRHPIHSGLYKSRLVAPQFLFFSRNRSSSTLVRAERTVALASNEACSWLTSNCRSLIRFKCCSTCCSNNAIFAASSTDSSVLRGNRIVLLCELAIQVTLHLGGSQGVEARSLRSSSRRSARVDFSLCSSASCDLRS